MIKVNVYLSGRRLNAIGIFYDLSEPFEGNGSTLKEAIKSAIARSYEQGWDHICVKQVIKINPDNSTEYISYTLDLI